MKKTENKKTLLLIRQEQEISRLFKAQKYIEVVKSVRNLKKILDAVVLDYSYFNNKVSCLIYEALSFAELGFYEDAHSILVDIGKRFAELKYSKIALRGIIRYPESKKLKLEWQKNF